MAWQAGKACHVTGMICGERRPLSVVRGGGEPGAVGEDLSRLDYAPDSRRRDASMMSGKCVPRRVGAYPR
ncbi:hypothetical protein U875_27140 [Pandoraea pnomenusa 3kgm]|nr:hypothetical protein U875_27140 [Pandoraea pnomenusa 3kgm]ANC44680.1 hypothetical protein A6P55_11230 [Pandoraea pnomenusa]